MERNTNKKRIRKSLEEDIRSVVPSIEQRLEMLNSENFVESAKSFVLDIIESSIGQGSQPFRYNLNDLYDTLKWLKEKAKQEQLNKDKAKQKRFNFDSILIDPKVSQSINSIITDGVKGIFPDDLLPQLALESLSRRLENSDTRSYRNAFECIFNKIMNINDPSIRQNILKLNNFNLLSLSLQKKYTIITRKLLDLSTFHSDEFVVKVLTFSPTKINMNFLIQLKEKVGDERLKKILRDNANKIMEKCLEASEPARVLELFYQEVDFPQGAISPEIISRTLRSAVGTIVKTGDRSLLDWLRSKLGPKQWQASMGINVNIIISKCLESFDSAEKLRHIYQDLEIPQEAISLEAVTRIMRSILQKNDISLLNWLKDKMGERFQETMVKGANEIIKMALQYPNPGTMLEHLYVGIKIPREKISKGVIDHARALDSKNSKNGNTPLLDLLGGKSKQSLGCVISRRRRRSAMSCRLNANEYIERLRELPIEEQIRVTEANAIEFIGSAREVGQAEKARDLLRTETMTVAQKSYEMDELFKNPQEERILDLFEGILQSKNPNLSEDTSQSKNPKYQELMNAAGRILFIQGAHGAVLSCIKQEGSVTISTKDCAFSFSINLINN